jgi:hypothetical protein
MSMTGLRILAAVSLLCLPFAARTQPLEATVADVLAQFPVYPHTDSPVRLGDELASLGTRVKAVSFRTADAPEEVLPFYVAAFRAAGLHVAEIPPGLTPEPAVAAVDPDRGVNKVVWAQRESSGSRVTLAIAPTGMIDRAQARGAERAPVELPPGCGAPTRSDARDGDRVTTVLVVGCAEPPGEVLEAVTSGLDRQGFASRDEDPAMRSHGVVELRRGRSSSPARATAKDGRTSLVMVRQGPVAAAR